MLIALAKTGCHPVEFSVVGAFALVIVAVAALLVGFGRSPVPGLRSKPAKLPHSNLMNPEIKRTGNLNGMLQIVSILL